LVKKRRNSGVTGPLVVSPVTHSEEVWLWSLD
jgi:hypothetical protein